MKRVLKGTKTQVTRTEQKSKGHQQDHHLPMENFFGENLIIPKQLPNQRNTAPPVTVSKTNGYLTAASMVGMQKENFSGAYNLSHHLSPSQIPQRIASNPIVASPGKINASSIYAKNSHVDIITPKQMGIRPLAASNEITKFSAKDSCLQMTSSRVMSKPDGNGVSIVRLTPPRIIKMSRIANADILQADSRAINELTRSRQMTPTRIIRKATPTATLKRSLIRNVSPSPIKSSRIISTPTKVQIVRKQPTVLTANVYGAAVPTTTVLTASNTFNAAPAAYAPVYRDPVYTATPVYGVPIYAAPVYREPTYAIPYDVRSRHYSRSPYRERDRFYDYDRSPRRDYRGPRPRQRSSYRGSRREWSRERSFRERSRSHRRDMDSSYRDISPHRSPRRQRSRTPSRRRGMRDSRNYKSRSPYTERRPPRYATINQSDIPSKGLSSSLVAPSSPPTTNDLTGSPPRGAKLMNTYRPPPPPKFRSRIEKSLKTQNSVSKKNISVPPKSSEQYVAPSKYKAPELIPVVDPLVNNSSTITTTKRTVRREAVKKTEVEDYRIENRDQFFNNFRPAGFGEDIEDTTANKLSLDPTGNTMYAAGVNGTHVLTVDGPTITRRGPIEVDKKSTTVKCLRTGDIILQEPNSNNLVLADMNLSTLKKIDGKFESGAVVEDLHCYRHSLDYAFFLWKSGNDSLSIVQTSTFECVDQINDFWTYNGNSMMPIAAVSNLTADKIVAVSAESPENQIIHYYEDTAVSNISYARPLNLILPSMNQIKCLEVSYDEQRVYLAGVSTSGIPGVVACEFKESLAEISTYLMTDLDYKCPYRMKRVNGTEVLIIGCIKHFAIVEFSNGQLSLLSSLQNIHDNEISDFVFHDNYLYSTAFNEPIVKATEFGSVSAGPIGNPDSRYMDINTIQYRFDGLDDLQKIEVSTDGARLFTGGKGLHVLSTENGTISPIEIDYEKDISYFALKATPSSYLIMQEPTTNNLVILQENLDFERSVEGKQKCIFDQYHLRNPHFTGEDDFCIWFSGTSSICVVDLTTLNVTEIPGFLPEIDEGIFGVAMRCVAKEGGDVIIVSYLLDGMWSFAYYHTGIEPDNHLLKEVLPRFNQIYDMETSYDKSVFFCSGTTGSDITGIAEGTLAAISFDQAMQTIEEKVFTEYDLQACSTIKRFPDTDDLIVGCFKHMLIVSWVNETFVVNNLIENVHTNILVDITLFQNEIYSVCQQDQFISKTTFQYNA